MSMKVLCNSCQTIATSDVSQHLYLLIVILLSNCGILILTTRMNFFYAEYSAYCRELPSTSLFW